MRKQLLVVHCSWADVEDSTVDGTYAFWSSAALWKNSFRMQLIWNQMRTLPVLVGVQMVRYCQHPKGSWGVHTSVLRFGGTWLLRSVGICILRCWLWQRVLVQSSVTWLRYHLSTMCLKLNFCTWHPCKNWAWVISMCRPWTALSLPRYSLEIVETVPEQMYVTSSAVSWGNCSAYFQSSSQLDALNCQVKPDFCAVGTDTIAYGMNNRVWYCKYDGAMKEVRQRHKQVENPHSFVEITDCDNRLGSSYCLTSSYIYPSNFNYLSVVPQSWLATVVASHKYSMWLNTCRSVQ